MLTWTDYQHIYDAYQRGDLDVAIRMAKDCLRRNRYDGRAWELLGLIQYSRGRIKIAVSALERASLIVPLRPAARVCLGHGYGRIGRINLSRDLLLELIDDETMPVPLLLQVASGLDAISQPNLAMNACRAAIRRDPDLAQPYYDLGYYAARCGLPVRVTDSLARKAISLAPENVCFRVGLASLLVKQDRCREAYRLVESFSNEQIERIPCACCLRRIVDLYESARDYRRVVVAQQQLLHLELQNTSTECD